ncbi:RNA polymerase sigma factor [Asticcacaulis sp. AND118]|uniref:RNA polymerase sigma factor n=1 Tax=Asticcacaulis sp. AND118 TaxID=2840468 RepID=UPI001CFF8B55|nr:sigma-70 family RNA polymerase sigma factor [Asticcacaulis sp. AND118]UDF05231.1 sigma-70 family RNA polymerase sigma factor [Asticcacaulis sp. AND118]
MRPDAAATRVGGLIERLDGRLRRYLGRALRPEDADDALQDIYARLMRLAHREPPPEFNITYVFKTADSVMRDLYRRRRRRESDQHVELSDNLPEDAPTPFDELRWRQNADLLRQAIRKLTPQERLVLMLHRVEGLKLNEISQKQGIPLRSVQRLLADALAKCRHNLKDSGWYEQ